MMTTTGKSHEYWVEPKTYQVSKNEMVNAKLKNGVDFVGTTYPYIKSNIVSLKNTVGGESQTISGRNGDEPAIAFSAKENGLNIVSYFNTPSTLVFNNDYEKFKSYFRSEGAQDLIARHEALGFPTDKIREIYSRCAKALVQVGSPEKSDLDQHTGMPAELIALQNPYALKAGEQLQIQMTWLEKPQANMQVRVFEKLGTDDEGKAKVIEKRPRTDREGLISIIPKPGAEYLLSSVMLLEKGSPYFSKESEAHWESYWASLTFKVPE